MLHLHRSNNGDLSSELLVHHKSEDAKHSRTSVVQLNRTLAQLRLLVERVPPEVEGSVAEIAHELVSSARDVLHDARLQKSNKQKDLAEAVLGNGIRSIKSGISDAEGIEGISGLVDASGEEDARAGDDLSQESQHSDTAVLDLDVAKTIEAILVGIVEHAEGVVEAKRRLGTKLGLEGAERRRGLGGRGRGEGGRGGGEGGEDGELHHVAWIVWESYVRNRIRTEDGGRGKLQAAKRGVALRCVGAC
ncbi:hypothetical protein THAOC_37575 [Thalassiosira oceanica]|uniref:Uncharacterized protein n=1 Tax=Thalassiosira oceanica TaxID=159749 RepID=K0QZW7_THAOC|nr:hypothetical protein THAOC_37575 [Thalassiosira oceanica]|eukprot:EJK43934.1 hypothetical protein THAOC_37575 [Thalassiosira oceanica]